MTSEWPESQLRAGRRAWRLSLVGTLVSALGGGLTLPFLFVYLHEVRLLTLPVAGLVVAIGAVSAFVLSPVSGALGDRIGLGRLLAMGLVVSAAGTTLLALSGNVVGAFFAVALTAAGDCFTRPSLNGLVALQLPQRARPQAYALRYGLLNAGIGVGGLVSGFVVSVNHPASFQLIYLLDATGTLLFAAIVVIGMRGSPGFSRSPVAGTDDSSRLEPPPLPSPKSGRRGYRSVLANRPFVAFLICSFFFGLFGYAQVNGPWAEFATLLVGSGPRTIGIAFAANTATIVVFQLPISRLTRRWRRSRLLFGAGLLWTVAWAVSALAMAPALHGTPAFIALAVSLGVFGLGETFFSVVGGALPNDLAEPGLRGRYNSASSATASVTGFVGPPLAGLLLGSAVPASWIFVIVAGMALTTAGALLFGRVLPPAIDRPLQPAPTTP